MVRRPFCRRRAGSNQITLDVSARHRAAIRVVSTIGLCRPGGVRQSIPPGRAGALLHRARPQHCLCAADCDFVFTYKVRPT